MFSVCVFALSCVTVCGGGRLEAKINGIVFGCIPEEHLHQSHRVAPLKCVCVAAQGPLCVLDTGKIESTEELPYHQFTVPAFVSNVHLCVCVRFTGSAMHMRSYCSRNCFCYFHQDNSSSLSVLEWLKCLFLLLLWILFNNENGTSY